VPSEGAYTAFPYRRSLEKNLIFRRTLETGGCLVSIESAGFDPQGLALKKWKKHLIKEKTDGPE
jgi:hypothetical protein